MRRLMMLSAALALALATVPLPGRGGSNPPVAAAPAIAPVALGGVAVTGAVGAGAVDPQLGNEIEAQAKAALGERYGYIRLADGQTGFVLGVVEPVASDDAWLADLSLIAPVTVAEAPVGQAQLDRAVVEAKAALSDEVLEVTPDYVTGLVQVTVDQSDLGVAEAKLDQTAKLDQAGVPIEVQPGEAYTAMETLNPPETNTSGPLRAGKEINIANRSLCTSNALVTIGGVRQMLTAGHCGNTGDAVKFGSTTLGSMGYSSWGTVSGATITADVARFPVGDTAKASIFQSPTAAIDLTGWADPVMGATVCHRGRTTNKEVCGPIQFINQAVRMDQDGGGYRMITGMAAAKVASGRGDSGGPVYYKGPSGAVLVGILSGASTNGMTIFSPARVALRLSGTALMRSAGLGVPVATSLDTPFTQVTLSPDMTNDGRGEVLAVDRAGRLVIYSTQSNGTLVSPPGLIGTGFGGSTVFAPGDWDSNGIPDLITITGDGKMYLHSGAGEGRLNPAKLIGIGWGGFQVVPMGDLTSDGAIDLLAVKDNGDMYLYAGTGGGGFRPHVKVGIGWKGHQLLTTGDVTGDGKSDLLSINFKGELHLFAGRGNASFQAARKVGVGWGGYSIGSGADLNGDGLADLVGKNPVSRNLYLYRATGGGYFNSMTHIGSGW